MKLILYATLFLYFFIPFQFALNPADNFDVAIIRVIIILITLSYFVYALWVGNFFIPRGWIVSFLLAFLMWTIFSLFYTPILPWTTRKVIFLLSFAPIIIVLTALFKNFSSAKIKIIQATVLGAMIISLIGIGQFVLQFVFPLNTILAIWSYITPFFLGGTFSTSVIAHNSWLVHVGTLDLMRAIAFFPDPHIFAFYLGLTTPLALSLYFITKQKFWIICFAIMLVANLLTFSRGGYIGIFSGFIIGFVLLWPQIKTNIRHLIVLLLCSFLFMLFIPHNPIASRLISSFDHTDTSNTHRVALWSDAVTQITIHPITGTGLGAYSYIVNPRTNYRTPFYVHNLALDITVELGMIGLVLFYGIFISLLIILYKHRADFIALFSFISISIFLLHSLFDTPLFSVHIFPLLLLFIALGASYENTK